MKYLVFGQTKINENYSKKFTSTNKTLESINAKLEGLSSSFRRQLSFNKMFETQLAQIAAALPTLDRGKILRHPKSTTENVNVEILVGNLLATRCILTMQEMMKRMN